MMAETRISSLFYCLITLLVLRAFSTATIHTDQHVIGWLGKDVRLPCDFTYPDVIALYWTNSSGKAKVSFFRENPRSFDDRFTMNDDFSLVIRNVQVSDEGRYSCHLELDSGQSFTNHTELSIYASPSIPHIQQCTKDPSENNIMNRHMICAVETSNTHPFNLECRVTGFRPNVTLEWISSRIVKQPIGEPFQIKLPDGTWEREVAISVTAKLGEEQDYTCTVRGEATNGTAWSTTATVTGIVPSPLSFGAWVGIGIAVTLVFICISGAALRKLFVLCLSRDWIHGQRRPEKLPTEGSNFIQLLPADTPRPNIEGSYERFLNPGMNRPHDVICHQGHYIVTDRFNCRVISVNPVDSSSKVLCKKKDGSLSCNMSPYGIVALPDSTKDFLFTDRANSCILGYVDDECKIWGKLPQNKQKVLLTGITVDSAGLVYVADYGNHCIHVFDKTGKYSRFFGDSDLKSPLFLKFNSKGHLFVTDDHAGVKIFEKNDETFELLNKFTIRAENRSWTCRGLTIDKHDYIYVTARTTTLYEKVAIYDPNCEPILFLGGLMHFRYVRGVCCDYENNYLVVVDGGKVTQCLRLYKLYDQKPHTITSAGDE